METTLLCTGCTNCSDIDFTELSCVGGFCDTMDFKEDAACGSMSCSDFTFREIPKCNINATWNGTNCQCGPEFIEVAQGLNALCVLRQEGQSLVYEMLLISRLVEMPCSLTAMSVDSRTGRQVDPARVPCICMYAHALILSMIQALQTGTCS